MISSSLIVFVKNSIPGKVKTRLAAEIGDVRALEIYNRLLLHTLEVTRDLAVTRFVYYSDVIPEQDVWPDDLYQKRLQAGQDLGTRMDRALSETLDLHQHVILIGSDIADLDTTTLQDAFHALQFADVVIGPATDGGYYLIGCKNAPPDIFKEIAWSTDKVFIQTLRRLIETHVDFRILKSKTDIDTIEDLERIGWEIK